MLLMDKKVIRFLARMGARGSLGQALFDYAADDNDFFAVSADLAHASGYDRIIKNYPERFVDVGIAEQNLIGVSGGLAKSGIPVVATTWAMFASARVADQVRNFMGYMQLNIKLVGMDSGLIQSRFSYSHANPPDISIMRAIPGIVILSPCDGIEIYKAVYAAMKFKGPVYIRLTGGDLLPIIHKDSDFEFKIGKAITIKEGDDVVFISCGTILSNVLKAADMLENMNISVKVIDMHTISPLDIDILDEISNCKLLVTVEEHLLQGGLGSAIAEYYIQKKIRPQQLMLGVNNIYTQPGTINFVQEKMGLLPEQIVVAVKGKLNII
ncbi:transketolase family protein [Schaedlerella arabinosiphila]|uniref:transketolase family protein n=1 Tax=Schaedlerella arabinosiphila TaxID=2044587 RepID=UPI002557E8A5|nr:transketolase C-terminal domain-containing protein [Schaedlerella arabinosiphila]